MTKGLFDDFIDFKTSIRAIDLAEERSVYHHDF